MILSANINASISIIAGVAILVVLLGLFLKKLKQPYLIAYIAIGVALGSHGLDVFESEQQIEFMGEIGIILLFFFIGMEISLPAFVRQWRVALLGTFMQIAVSVVSMLVLGSYIGWGVPRSVVVGFVIALSSSAVVIRLLEEKKLMDTKMGKYVLSILLTQDIAIAPILIITALLGGTPQSNYTTVLQFVGAALIVAIFIILYKKRTLRLTFLDNLEEDHELQVFTSILACAAGALLLGLLGLSPALGAFVGGMVVHAARETDWIHDNLHPFRIIFVAVFFISVGAQIDLQFLQEHLVLILVLMLMVFVINHLVNALVLRTFGCTLPQAILGGALMAQIGEMSFLVCFTAYQTQIITDFGYNFSICLISLTLLCSPLWILATEKLIGEESLLGIAKKNITKKSVTT